MAGLKRRLFGYSSASVRSALSEREAELDRASKNAGAAEQRAERLSSDLSKTQGRLAELEEEVVPLRGELEELRSELQDAKETILGRDEQLRAAESRVATLEDQLRQQTERLERATAEAAESQASLRALEESDGFEAAMNAQRERVAELEELVEGYRKLIDDASPGALASAEQSVQEPPASPSSAGELATVIEVAEQAVASILESTRNRADEELRAVDDERERIRQEIESMTAWRDRAEPMIASLQAAMHEMQSQAAKIGLRVDEALRPVTNAVSALSTQLASLDGLGAPLEGSTEAPAPSEPDRVTELPDEPLVSRDSYR